MIDLLFVIGRMLIVCRLRAVICHVFFYLEKACDGIPSNSIGWMTTMTGVSIAFVKTCTTVPSPSLLCPHYFTHNAITGIMLFL